MYEELVKALWVCVDKDKDCSDCPYYSKCMGNDSEKHKAMVDAADAIEELNKMVSADNARAYLDRDELMNTLMKHKQSFDLEDRYGDYGMGFSEAVKVVAMTYPVYIPEPPKEE